MALGKWSPIQACFVWSQVWLQTELAYTKFCYQLIIAIKKSFKICGQAFSVFKVETLDTRDYFASGKNEKIHPRACMHNGVRVLSNYT